MIAYKNSLITISFEPETDILFLDWTNFDKYTILEVEHSIHKLVEIINNYDVKNVLVDASKANIDITIEEYTGIINELVLELGQTRVEKLARIMTLDPIREEVYYKMRQAVNFPFEFEDFKTKDKALAWLTE